MWDDTYRQDDRENRLSYGHYVNLLDAGSTQACFTQFWLKPFDLQIIGATLMCIAQNYYFVKHHTGSKATSWYVMLWE